ncbi:MAG: protein-S-isoprenylcysteine O-methyltransferase Ste14 [Hyphomicrobiaceae bacterium]|jgi:protein-S-isoprenylcysteine O-methyltransferase Ste14
MDLTDVVVLVAYGSLILELTVFPIPSEASTLDLLTHGSKDTATSGALSQARNRSLANKVLRFLLPTAIGVVLFLLPLLAVLWPPLRQVFFPITLDALGTAGLVIIITGRLLTFWSVLQLRSAKRRASIPAGLFACSRNPGLVGMFVFYLGLCLAFGGPWLWLGIPLYFGNMHHRVRLEEAQLTATHGDRWRHYQQRVARYLPLPGLR